MMLLALILAQPMNLNQQPIIVQDEGVRVSSTARATTINCSGAGVTCTQSGTVMTLDVPGGGGGGSSGVDGGYVDTTTAALTLYVDPTGSDSNACTASGASACLTWAGVAAKIPQKIRHAVLVNVAAGTYAEALTVTGFQLGRNPATSTNPSLTINGTLGAPTLTTGTASGSVTAYAAASGATLAVVTDGAQSWTTDELRGSLLLMGSGGSSGSYFPIVSNTATTATISYNGTIAAGNTYTITTPKSIFTSTAVYTGNVGSGTITTSNIKLSTGASTFFQQSQNTTSFAYTRMVFSSNSGGPIADGNMRLATFTNCYFISTTAVASCMFSMLNSRVRVTNSYFRSEGAGAVPLCNFGKTEIDNLSAHIEGYPDSEALIEYFDAVQAGGVLTVTLHCLNPAHGAGFLAPHPGESGQGPIGMLGFSKLAVKDCLTGVRLESNFMLSAVGVTIENATTGISITNGGTFNYRYSAPTFTGVTTEILIDGTEYTHGFISTLLPPIVTGFGNSRYANIY